MHVDGKVGARRRRLEVVQDDVEIAGHLRCRLIAVRRIFLQSLEHDRVDLRRQLFIEGRRRGDACLAHLLQHGHLVLAGEELPSGQQLE